MDDYLIRRKRDDEVFSLKAFRGYVVEVRGETVHTASTRRAAFRAASELARVAARGALSARVLELLENGTTRLLVEYSPFQP